MSTTTTTAVTTVSGAERWELALVEGNLDQLTPAERLELVRRVCAATGLTMETQPFQYIRLSGKLTLYAKRDATDQLRRVHKVSITIVGRETIGDVYVVTARATTSDGRTDESTGAVSIKGLQGEALANAFLKAETKSKRRVTLSICGLGFLDETEVQSIPGAEHVDAAPAKKIEAKATIEQLNEIARLHSKTDLGAGYWGALKEHFNIQKSSELTEKQALSVIGELTDIINEKGGKI
jgi:hypothetical protein